MKLTLKDSAAAEHVKMMQGIIARMARNSASCKQWCIAILTALLALAGKDGDSWNTQVLEIAIYPVILFYFLDCFYLGIEREMKKSQSEFLWKIRRNEDIDNELYLGGKIKSEITSEKENVIISRIDRLQVQILNTVCALFSFPLLAVQLK